MSMFQTMAFLTRMMAQFQDSAPVNDLGKKESEVIKWGGILIVLIVVGGGVIMLIRRKLHDAAANSGADAGFSLSDLRAMRDRGEITSEEYEQTRARVIAKVKGKGAEPPRKGEAIVPPAEEAASEEMPPSEGASPGEESGPPPAGV